MVFTGESSFSKRKRDLVIRDGENFNSRGRRGNFHIGVESEPCVQWRSFRIEDEADFKPINISNASHTTFAVRVGVREAVCVLASSWFHEHVRQSICHCV